MRNFLFVGDRREVLGVWEVGSEAEATKLHLKLSLQYPNCQTWIRQAPSFETLKAEHGELEFGGLEPDVLRAG